MKLSHAGNLFGSVLSIEADWRVMTPTTYGDSNRINPMIDFLSILPILFFRVSKNSDFLISVICDFMSYVD